MNKAEFEAAYAQRSGVTVEFLHDHGRFAVPCECGKGFCEGWIMERHEVDPMPQSAKDVVQFFFDMAGRERYTGRWVISSETLNVVRSLKPVPGYSVGVWQDLLPGNPAGLERDPVEALGVLCGRPVRIDESVEGLHYERRATLTDRFTTPDEWIKVR